MCHFGVIADGKQNNHCLYYTKLRKIFKPLQVFCCVANGRCPRKWQNKAQFRKFFHSSANVHTPSFCCTYVHLFICAHDQRKARFGLITTCNWHNCYFARSYSFFGGLVTPLRGNCSTNRRNETAQQKVWQPSIVNCFANSNVPLLLLLRLLRVNEQIAAHPKKI